MTPPHTDRCTEPLAAFRYYAWYGNGCLVPGLRILKLLVVTKCDSLQDAAGLNLVFC